MKNSIIKTGSSNSLTKLDKKNNNLQLKSSFKKDNFLSIKSKPADSNSPVYLRRDKKSLTSTNKSLSSKDVSSPYQINNSNNNETNDFSNFRKKPINIFKQNFKSCNKNLPLVKTRRDRNGILIQKNSKNHNIIFKDKINSNFPLVEVIDVESYKKENAQESYDGEYPYNEGDDDSSVSSMS